MMLRAPTALSVHHEEIFETFGLFPLSYWLKVLVELPLTLTLVGQIHHPSYGR